MASFIIQAELEKTEFNLSLSYENELLPDSKETKSEFYLFGCWSKKKIGKGRTEWGDKWCWRPLDHYYATLSPRQTHHGKPHNSSQTQAADTRLRDHCAPCFHLLMFPSNDVSINWFLENRSKQELVWSNVSRLWLSIVVLFCIIRFFKLLLPTKTNLNISNILGINNVW